MKVFSAIAGLIVLFLGTMGWLLKSYQPDYPELEKSFTQGTAQSLKFDAQGIPTLVVPDWDEFARIQGYIVAAERLWQMELMARHASGELSEWFGPKAIDHDTKRRQEFWTEVAQKHVDLLPEEERLPCENYAKGVNQFIDDPKAVLGIEYTILRAKPRRWSCRDTIMILMSMSESLTKSADKERFAEWISRQLPEPWRDFLYPKMHPWNHPMFSLIEKGKNKVGKIHRNLEIPDFLTPRSFQTKEIEKDLESDIFDSTEGSNAWVLSRNGKAVLANDPHLAYRVPQLWYALRARIQDQTVAGVALPGVPGVVLGMNRDIAWAFTNTGEDVDDDLFVELSADLNSFQGADASWQNLDISQSTVQVRNQKNPVIVERRSFGGNPIVQRTSPEKRWVLRQWIAFEPGMVGLPILGLNRAKNWDEFNASIDRLKAPSQNILYLDKKQNFGYRTSGVGIRRQISGLRPAPYAQGRWLGFQSVDERPRIHCPQDKRPECTQGWIASANEEVWDDSFGHHWATDDRKERLDAVLSKETTLANPQDMYQLQLDTTSRFHVEILSWFRSLASQHKITIPEEELKRWNSWKGSAAACPQCFWEGVQLEKILRHAVVNRVMTQFEIDQTKGSYRNRMERAWILKILEGHVPLGAFGINEQEFCKTALSLMEKSKQKVSDYTLVNRWAVQHPFVKNVPGIGWWFRVIDHPQKGFQNLVRSERRLEGASVRMIWDPSQPKASLWSFPVGQSGHAASPFYRDQQKPWFHETPIEVYP